MKLNQNIQRSSFFTCIMLLLLVGMVLSACKSSESDGERAPSAEQPTAPSQTGSPNNDSESAADFVPQFPRDPVEIVIYNNSGPDVQQLENLYGDFIRERLPHVTLKFIGNEQGNRLNDLIVRGQKVDLIRSSLPEVPTSLVHFNYQYDISELVKKYNFDLSIFHPSIIEGMRNLTGGELYGLPFNNLIGVLTYNKELFDRFGVEYPYNGISWDEVHQLAVRMTRVEDGIQYRGIGMQPNYMMAQSQLSVQLQDPETYEARFLEDEVIRETQFLASFYDIPGNEADRDTYLTYGQQLAAYQNGQVAMFAGTFNIGFTAWEAVDYDMIMMPFRSEAPGVGMQTLPGFYFLTSVSEHKDAAFEVLTLITSAEIQQKDMIRNAFIPSLVEGVDMSLLGQERPDLMNSDRNTDVVPERLAKLTVTTRFNGLFNQFWVPAFNEIILGEKDVVTALREAKEAHDAAVRNQLSQ